MSNNLQGYINTQLKRGVSKERIRESLKTQGWQDKDIEKSFNLNTNPNNTNLEEPKKTSFKKPSKKLTTIIIFIILGLVVAGGAVFSYFKFIQTPEKILAKMMNKMTEVKTIEYENEINVEYNLDESQNLSMFLDSETESNNSEAQVATLNMAGSLDFRQENEEKSYFKINIKSSEMPDSEVGLETRFIEKIIYFSLTSLPSTDFIDLSQLENQWVKIDIKEIEDQFGGEYTKNKEKLNLTLEQKEEIREKLKESNSFEITEKLDSEIINGVNNYHYKFKINKENLITLMEDVSAIIYEEKLSEDELLEVKNFSKEIGNLEGEIWIGKENYFLHKITLNIQEKETEEEEKENKEEEMPLKNINISILLKNHNQDVEITAPESSTPIEEFIKEALSVIMPPTQNLGLTNEAEKSDIYENTYQEGGFELEEENDTKTEKNTSIEAGLNETEKEELKNKDSDDDGLSDYEEMFIYNTFPLVSDTDGDGYLDGEEVENGYNPLGPGELN
jgi:hypothetical protein